MRVVKPQRVQSAVFVPSVWPFAKFSADIHPSISNKWKSLAILIANSTSFTVADFRAKAGLCRNRSSFGQNPKFSSKEKLLFMVAALICRTMLVLPKQVFQYSLQTIDDPVPAPIKSPINIFPKKDGSPELNLDYLSEEILEYYCTPI